MSAEWENRLYFGANLDILREYVADESVDLIHLDRPQTFEGIVRRRSDGYGRG